MADEEGVTEGVVVACSGNVIQHDVEVTWMNVGFDALR